MREVGAREVLHALLGQPPSSGFEVCATVGAASGRRCTPSKLLPRLLVLEQSGLLQVDRSGDPHLYALTPQGARAAYETGAAAPDPALLVMADLVGFTRFTERAGDAAAHAQASRLTALARTAARAAGGELVKSLGDGVLLALPPGQDPARLVRGLARTLAAGDPPWRLHAGAHVGCPIRHGGDVYGRDVNLVARLCAQAQAGEMLVTDEGGGQAVELAGVDAPVQVRRLPLEVEG